LFRPPEDDRQGRGAVSGHDSELFRSEIGAVG